MLFLPAFKGRGVRYIYFGSATYRARFQQTELLEERARAANVSRMSAAARVADCDRDL